MKFELQNTYIDTREMKDNQEIQISILARYKDTVSEIIVTLDNTTWDYSYTIYNVPTLSNYKNKQVKSYDLNLSILESIIKNNENIQNIIDVSYNTEYRETNKILVLFELLDGFYDINNEIIKIKEDINSITHIQLYTQEIILYDEKE